MQNANCSVTQWSGNPALRECKTMSFSKDIYGFFINAPAQPSSKRDWLSPEVGGVSKLTNLAN